MNNHHLVPKLYTQFERLFLLRKLDDAVSDLNEEPKEVGQRIPNGFGLYDMHGNLYEWTTDWYGCSYPQSATDPYFGSASSYRVGWGNFPFIMRASYRNIYGPTSRCSVGFRLGRHLQHRIDNGPYHHLIENQPVGSIGEGGFGANGNDYFNFQLGFDFLINLVAFPVVFILMFELVQAIVHLDTRKYSY